MKAPLRAGAARMCTLGEMYIRTSEPPGPLVLRCRAFCFTQRGAPVLGYSASEFTKLVRVLDTCGAQRASFYCPDVGLRLRSARNRKDLEASWLLP